MFWIFENPKKIKGFQKFNIFKIQFFNDLTFSQILNFEVFCNFKLL